MKKRRLLIFSTVLVLTTVAVSFKFLSKSNPFEDLPLEQIKLPDGFKIAIYAEVPNARSMVLSENGTLFVGNRSEDNVYAVLDTDGDMVADKTYIIDKGLKMPNGVALKDGDLYVAAVSKILKYENIEANLDNPPEPEVIFDNYPTETHHGWKYIAFGPDGLLYVPVGAPCNICNRDNPIYASITRIDVANPNPEIVASGIRNTVGFDWDPKTGNLWFTDNGRDMMGDDTPPCELNVITEANQHFGYPFCHGGTVSDPEFGAGKPCTDYTAPALNFVAHVAPLGMNFYEGAMFPGEYDNKIFVAQHGSWNRSKKSGYVVLAIDHDDASADNAKVFASGWLDDETQKAWGRPVDVINMPDGSILISDDYADVVYRVSYEGL
jgi:glucose/arabinose dehydrogenase